MTVPAELPNLWIPLRPVVPVGVSTASKEMMLGIAKDYERLAERAEQRAREERKKKES
jgi:hypothetical protein